MGLVKRNCRTVKGESFRRGILLGISMIIKRKEDSMPMDSMTAVLPEIRKYLMRREIIIHRLY